MNIRLTEFDSSEAKTEHSCTFCAFKLLNADGIDDAEMASIERTLQRGESYRLGVAQGAWCLIERINP